MMRMTNVNIYTSVYRLQFWCLLGVIKLPITKDSENMKKTLEKLKLINASGCEIQVYSRLVLFKKKKLISFLIIDFYGPFCFVVVMQAVNVIGSLGRK